jgi:hypothetical protein
MTSSTITPRQRVQTALTHEEPDRVPLALGGGPYGLEDELYLRLVKHLDLGEPVPPFRAGDSISYMDDRLLERLGADLRYCWPGLLPNSPVIPGKDGAITKLLPDMISPGVDVIHPLEPLPATDLPAIKAQFASSGGYILAPSNHLQADVPPENVITLFETAREFGGYLIMMYRPAGFAEYRKLAGVEPAGRFTQARK